MENQGFLTTYMFYKLGLMYVKFKRGQDSLILIVYSTNKCSLH
jgi:hypothetical protein